MYFPCSGGLQYQTCSCKFCKIYRKYVSARLYVWLSCSDSACKFIKKETLTQIFSCESYKVFKFFFFYRSLYRSPPADYDYLCFASFFEIFVKKACWMILQSSETYLCRLSQSPSAYYYLKMLKFLQCCRQPGAPRKRSDALVNSHPAIVDIFQKFFENGQCI